MPTNRSQRSYQREIAKLKTLFGDMRWVQPMYNGNPSCPCCGNQQHWGCEPGCALNKLHPEETVDAD